MSDQNTQWPTEDEDFDTVTDPEELKATFKNDNGDSDTVDSVQTGNNESQDSENNLPSQQADEQTSVTAEESSGNSQSDTQAVTDEANQPVTGTISNEDTNISNPEVVPEEPANQVNEGSDYQTENEQVAPTADVPKPKAHRPQFNPSGVVRLAIEGLLVLAVIGLGLSVWVLKSDNNNLKRQVTASNQNPEALIQKQTQSIIDNVSKLIQLPTGESPTIANVTNATQAKQQSQFFSKAQNGDKVLMYVKAGEAILYRPSTNKIIIVAPLTFNASNTGASSTSTTK